MAASSTGIDDDDDDFGDFGGFEAAEPVAAVEAETLPSVQAAATPWAVMAAAAPSAGTYQPDSGAGQSAQGAVDLQTAPGALCQPHVAAQPNAEQPHPIDDHSAATNWAVVGEDVDQKAASEASEGRFEANFDNLSSAATSQSQNHWPSDATSKPQDTSNSSPREGAAANLPKAHSDLDLDLDLDLDDVISAAPLASESRPQASLPTDTDTAARLHTAEVQLSDANKQQQLLTEEKAKLEQDVAELRTLCESQADQLAAVQAQLGEQRTKYTDVQKKHQSDLEAIRGAGHKALVLCVEEYKELCKVAVLEQQEASQRAARDALADQAKEYQQTIQTQSESFQSQLNEFRKELEEKAEKSLLSQREKAQQEIRQALEKEQERNKKLLEEAVEESHIKHKRLQEEALEAERLRGKKAAEENQEDCRRVMAEVREDSVGHLKKVTEEEQARCQECVREALREEAVRQKEAMSEVLSQAKSEVQQCVAEYKQADTRVRHRSLASIDLFLEGARQQLSLLLAPPADQREEAEDAS